MDKGTIIKNMTIAVIILAVVYFSQNPSFSNLGKNVFSGSLRAVGGDYWAKGSNWVTNDLFPKIGGEVQKRGDMAQEGITEQKEKISESIGENIKNYFSGIVDSVFHSKENNSQSTETCEPCQPSQSPYQTPYQAP